MNITTKRSNSGSKSDFVAPVVVTIPAGALSAGDVGDYMIVEFSGAMGAGFTMSAPAATPAWTVDASKVNVAEGIYVFSKPIVAADIGKTSYTFTMSAGAFIVWTFRLIGSDVIVTWSPSLTPVAVNSLVSEQAHDVNPGSETNDAYVIALAGFSTTTPASLTVTQPGSVGLTLRFAEILAGARALWSADRVVNGTMTPVDLGNGTTHTHFAWTGSDLGSFAVVSYKAIPGSGGTTTITVNTAMETDTAQTIRNKKTRITYTRATETDEAQIISRPGITHLIGWVLNPDGYPTPEDFGTGNGFVINRRSAGSDGNRVDGIIREFQRPSGNGSIAAFGICGRANDDPAVTPYSGYTAAWFYRWDGLAWIELSLWLAGLQFLLGSYGDVVNPAPEPQPNDKLSITHFGSAIKVLVRDAERISVVNNQKLTGRFGGLYVWRNVESARMVWQDFDIQPFSPQLAAGAYGPAMETDSAISISKGTTITPLTSWSGTDWQARS